MDLLYDYASLGIKLVSTPY